jgi:hypothetical protein
MKRFMGIASHRNNFALRYVSHYITVCKKDFSPALSGDQKTRQSPPA